MRGKRWRGRWLGRWTDPWLAAVRPAPGGPHRSGRNSAPSGNSRLRPFKEEEVGTEGGQVGRAEAAAAVGAEAGSVVHRNFWNFWNYWNYWNFWQWRRRPSASVEASHCNANRYHLL